MGAKWYYMAKSWVWKPRPVGPISEADLLLRIDRGKITPKTMLRSSKTRGKWVPMHSVAPAMERWRQSHPDEQAESFSS